MGTESTPKRPIELSGRLLIDASARFFWWDESSSPNWTVERGETVRMEAVDGWNGRIASREDTADDCPPGETNPCTGPIRIEGASPGRTLVFDIQEVTCDTDQAVSVVMPGWGVLGERVVAPRTYVLPIRDGEIELPGRVLRPVDPMIGTIGVTPAGDRVPTLTPGAFGGNMDVPEMGAGSVLYLPIQTEGAGFGLGDSKALMGEGESAAAGAEISVSVEGRFDVIDGNGITQPLVRTGEEWIAVSSAGTVEAAGRTSFAQIIELVARELELDWDDARYVAGISGSMRICQTANPLVTVAYHVPREAVDFAWATEAFQA